MNPLRSRMQMLTQWFDQRPLRERVMLAVCLLVVVFFLWDQLLLKPLDQKTRNLRAQTSELTASLAELQAQEQVVSSRRDFDPDRENKQRLAELNNQVPQLKQQLQENVATLIPPQQMPAMLKELLRRQNGLELLSLENLPPEPLQLGAAAAVAEANIYRHRLRIVVAGDYLTALRYLQDLENMPQKMVWEQLEIETDSYPRARVLLQVYTLSPKESWISG